MNKRKSRIRWITPRRLAGVGCLVALALAAAFVAVLYSQIRSLFRPYQPSEPGGTMATRDVTVSRGSVAEGIQAYGLIAPARSAELGFRAARCRVVGVMVEPGQPVEAGQPLVQLDRPTLERDLAQANADLLDAQRALDEATSTGGAGLRVELEVAVAEARKDLDAAQRKLKDYDAGSGTPQDRRSRAATELKDARDALTSLRDSSERRKELDALQVTYNEAEVKHGPLVTIKEPTEYERDLEWLLRNDMLDKGEALARARLQYEMDLRAAEHRVVVAERELARLGREIAAGSPAVERALLVAALRQAEAALKQTQARLEGFDSGDTPGVAVAKAEAEVLKQEGKVADAEAALAEAELTAPFAGVVEQVDVTVGQSIASGATVVTVIDTSSVHIVARVSDLDIGRVKAGQAVSVTFDAFTGQPPLSGRLGDIPPYGKQEGGLSFFEVPVEVDAGEVPLQVGMSANLFVPLDRKDNVLVIPLAAVQTEWPDTSYVWLVRGNKAERRKVRLGIADGVNIEVLEGLSEGDVVRVPMYGPMGPGGPVMMRGLG